MKIAFILISFLIINPIYTFAQNGEAKNTVNIVNPQLEIGDNGTRGGSGGGNRIGTTPIGEDTRELVKAIEYSRINLLAYLYGRCRFDHSQWQCSSEFGNFKKIDSDVSLIFSKMIKEILQYEVTMMQNKSCLNSNQEETDGSRYVSYSNGTMDGVCISMPRLQKYLTKEELGTQPIALVAHEYAHLAGADENLAIKVQKVIIADFLSFFNSYYNRSANFEFTKFKNDEKLLESEILRSAKLIAETTFGSSEQIDSLLSLNAKLSDLVGEIYYDRQSGSKKLLHMDRGNESLNWSVIETKMAYILEQLWDKNSLNSSDLERYKPLQDLKPIVFSDENNISLLDYCQLRDLNGMGPCRESYRYKELDKNYLRSFENNLGLIFQLNDLAKNLVELMSKNNSDFSKANELSFSILIQ